MPEPDDRGVLWSVPLDWCIEEESIVDLDPFCIEETLGSVFFSSILGC